MSEFKLLIDGRLLDGARRSPVLNPATEEAVADCPRGDETQLNDAVAAAKRAFPAWSKTPRAARGERLLALAQAIQDDAEAFARLVTAEQGKTLRDSRGEVAGSVAYLRYAAGLELHDKVLRDDDTVRIVEQHSPLGVIAAITPWNVPLMLLMMKVGPALNAGNTMVIKPAPTTPLSTLKFGELCARILPPGVVNIVADENELGALLTAHPDVAKVAFTGSSATGKKVAAATAGTLKRLTLELGGNDAAIVLDDADPKAVAPGIFGGAMVNSGQICLAIKRVYCPENLYDDLCAELARLADEAVVDDGSKQGAQYGPLQNKQQYEKVKALIEEAGREGKIIAGGDVPDRPGYFIRPTIVRDIPEQSRLVQEEQFGPVLPVLKYSDVEDAIERANDTIYGLGGTVWSPNLERAYEVASRIDSGTVWVNKHLDLPFDVPFSGAKESGIGTELGGEEGLAEFTQRRIVNMAKATA